jgi:hypothetical protein
VTLVTFGAVLAICPQGPAAFAARSMWNPLSFTERSVHATRTVVLFAGAAVVFAGAAGVAGVVAHATLEKVELLSRETAATL